MKIPQLFPLYTPMTLSPLSPPFKNIGLPSEIAPLIPKIEK